MTKILDILNLIESDNSRLAKEAVFEKYKNDSVFKTVCFLTYDPFTQFYIRQIPVYEMDHPEYRTINLEDALKLLDNLSSRKETGNNAIEFLSNVLSHLEDEDDGEVIKRVIGRDLKCGASTSTINKTWPGLIPEYPVALSSAYDKKLIDKLDWSTPQIGQTKSDGGRCNVIIDHDGGVTVRSRSGKLIEVNGIFDYLAENIRSVMIDGELVCRNESGELLPRKESNGYLTSAVRGKLTLAESKFIHITAWDLIPYDDFKKEICKTPYLDRYNNLLEKVIPFVTNIEAVETTMINSPLDAAALYMNALDRGLEGIIVKDPKLVWESKRSKRSIKFKAERDADLLVVDIQMGSIGSKYEGMLGALVCESADGKIKVNVGSGLSDVDRTNLDWVGKIVQVVYNEKIQSSNGSWSLFLPRLHPIEKIRLDKTTANLFEELS